MGLGWLFKKEKARVWEINEGRSKETISIGGVGQGAFVLFAKPAVTIAGYPLVG